MSAPLVGRRSRARRMGNHLCIYTRPHRNGRRKFFQDMCVCKKFSNQVTPNSSNNWTGVSGWHSWSANNSANNRMMDPFTFRLPVQIQSRFVVSKSHDTLRAIQRLCEMNRRSQSESSGHVSKCRRCNPSWHSCLVVVA